MRCEITASRIVSAGKRVAEHLRANVINAVTEAIEGCRVALGPMRILQYCLQGLFHPARKVQEAYWKVYNNVYAGDQDGLVPAHPCIDDELDEDWRRGQYTCGRSCTTQYDPFG